MDNKSVKAKSPKVIYPNDPHNEKTSNLDEMQNICEELDIQIVDSEDKNASKKAKLDIEENNKISCNLNNIDIGSSNWFKTKFEKCIQNESDSSKANIQSRNENDIEPNIKFDEQFQKNNGTVVSISESTKPRLCSKLLLFKTS